MKAVTITRNFISNMCVFFDDTLQVRNQLMCDIEKWLLGHCTGVGTFRIIHA